MMLQSKTPDRVSLLSAGEGRNATVLAEVHFEEEGEASGSSCG